MTAAAPLLPVYTPDQIASYLNTDFWTVVGETPHKFNTSQITYNIENLTPAGKALATAALQTWAGVTGLTFVRQTTTSQLNFDDNQSGAFSSYTASGGVTQSSSINISTEWLSSYGTGINSYSFQTYIHEIGHSLGLGHAGNYNGSAGWSATAGGDNHFINDSWQATVMSYFDQDQNTFVKASGAYVVGPMMADIVAIQQLYGVPGEVRAGATTYGFNNTGAAEHNFANYTQGRMVAFTIYDSNGNDTIDASGFSANQLINLSGGSFSDVGGEIGNIGIATNTTMENALGGTGRDVIYGNTGDNYMRGGLGSDLIDGATGQDQAGLAGLNGGGHDLVQVGSTVYALNLANRSFDTITNVENFESYGRVIALSQVEVFNPLLYAASYNDLAAGYGLNGNAALTHYVAHGFFEGREVRFDPAQYLANHADLRTGLGGDLVAATNHFLTNGVTEQRLADDPLDYIASFADLIMGYRGNNEAQLSSLGLNHYQQNGYGEGRRNSIFFDVEQYLENHSDLNTWLGGDGDAAAAHYINNGYGEHRMWENPLEYIASFDDLVSGFAGQSASQMRASGLSHFQSSGFAEGRRAGINFDADKYLANYADLRVGFVDAAGNYDTAAATLHYIQHGYDEGRTGNLILV